MLIPGKGRVIGRFVRQKAVSKNIIVPFEKQEVQLLEIMFVSPECKEIQPGDIAIIPAGGFGNDVMLVDTENGEQEKFFVIAEANIDALYRDE